jgi:hypothetical protein
MWGRLSFISRWIDVRQCPMRRIALTCAVMNSNPSQARATAGKEITRRRLAQAAIWATPVIVAAKAAPAVAASGCPDCKPTMTVSGGFFPKIQVTFRYSCPGEVIAQGTSITWTIQNTGTRTETLTVASNDVALTSPISIPAGSTTTVNGTVTRDIFDGDTLGWSIDLSAGVSLSNSITLGCWTYCWSERIISGLFLFGATCPN